MAKKEIPDSIGGSNPEIDSPYIHEGSSKTTGWFKSRAAKITAISVGSALALGATFAGGAVAGQLAGGSDSGNFGIGESHDGPRVDGPNVEGPGVDGNRQAGPNGQRPPHDENGERGERDGDHDNGGFDDNDGGQFQAPTGLPTPSGTTTP